MLHQESISILLVEDDPNDRILIVDALSRARLMNSVHTVEDGFEALAFVRRQGKYENAPRPDVILLDLNLPRKDGRAVLSELKSDPLHHRIPVIVLTGSDSPADLVRSQAHNVAAYMRKPISLEELSAAIRKIGDLWFDLVRVPSHSATVGSSRGDARPRATIAPLLFAAPTRTRVLLVEDSPSDALLVRSVLAGATGQEFEIRHVLRLDDATSALADSQHDVILLDLGLPDSHGLDSVRSLRNAAPEVPILVLTSDQDEHVGIAALQHGAQDFLTKGTTDARVLTRAIRYAMERSLVDSRMGRSHRLEALGQLAGGIAHDFNNLLTVIRGSAGLLQEELPKDGETTDLVKSILNASERASSLTRQLLTFGRRQAVQPKPLDLNAVVGHMQGILSRLLGESVRVVLRLAPKVSPIRGDASMLDQVILNLAINARDAMPQGGNLTFETSIVHVDEATAAKHRDASSGRFTKLSISDTGTGIPASVLTRIFEPFFTTKGIGQGSGLGLATVYGIVREHGGFLTVHSVLNKGTTFEVFLPAIDDAPVEKPASVPPPKSSVGRTETVLVVEDEVDVRALVRRMLEREGFRVFEACTPNEAIAIWNDRQHSIDVVITDMMMPGAMTGFDLARVLREDRPDLPIIFTSGYSPDIANAPEPLREGDNFLGKPYKRQDLVDIVCHRLGVEAARSVAANA